MAPRHGASCSRRRRCARRHARTTGHAKNTVWQRLHEALAALSTNGRRVVVEDSGHYIQLDQPQAVIDAVDVVLDTAPRSRE